MLIGEKIDQLIKENGITAYKLSKDIYVSQSAISNWISGKKKPIAPLVKLIADYFNVSFDWLLNNKGDMKDGIDSSHVKPFSNIKESKTNIPDKVCQECMIKQERIDDLIEKCELYRKLISEYESQLHKKKEPEKVVKQANKNFPEVDIPENCHN